MNRTESSSKMGAAVRHLTLSRPCARKPAPASSAAERRRYPEISKQRIENGFVAGRSGIEAESPGLGRAAMMVVASGAGAYKVVLLD